MFGFDEAKEAHEKVYTDSDYGSSTEHKSHLSHELIAGAAAFEGFKLFEDKQRAAGKPVSHQFAKELLAGFAAGEVDKLAETKGMDFVDKERAHHAAKKQADHLYDQHYVQGQSADEYDPNRYGAPGQINERYGTNY